MKKAKLKRLYIIFGVINLIASIAQYFYLVDIQMSERLNNLYVLNVGYHSMYAFIGFFPRFQLFMVGEKNRIYPIVLKMVQVFSFLTLFAGVFMLGYLLVEPFIVGELKEMGLFFLGLPFGIILGSLKLKEFVLEKIDSL